MYPQLAYYYQHREYKLKYQKQYYLKNKEMISKYYKDYYKRKKGDCLKVKKNNRSRNFIWKTSSEEKPLITNFSCTVDFN